MSLKLLLKNHNSSQKQNENILNKNLKELEEESKKLNILFEENRKNIEQNIMLSKKNEENLQNNKHTKIERMLKNEKNIQKKKLENIPWYKPIERVKLKYYIEVLDEKIKNIEENNIKSLKEKLIDRNILFEQATKINKKEKELINKSKINIIKKEFEITKQKQLY